MTKSRLKNLAYTFYKSNFSEQILSFRGLHQGEDCYIFGDGVSLKWFSLSEFTDKIAITAGLLPFHKEFSALNTKYCILLEPYWFYNKYADKLILAEHYPQPAISKKYKEFIRRSPEIKFFVNFSNLLALNHRNVSFLFRELPGNDVFNESLAKINYFKGSVRATISLAIYMGFKNIYLVGFDYTHIPSLDLHWYEKGEGHSGTHPLYQQEFFTKASAFANIITVTLPNATSEYLESIDYSTLTGQPLCFQENTDLLDQAYLEALETWQGYTIN